MSLQLAAQHLAAQGRGPDKQLVHMSPREVAGLQALAMAHGGSLSINPDTGLPEAGFLDKLLPTIIGAGLMYFSGGTINPAMIGLGVGGVETLRTGDLSKGLMAGLGAYGGAGLSAGLAGGMTVTNPQAAQIVASQTAAPAAQAAQAGAEALYPILPPPEVYANPFVGTSAEFAGAEAVGRQNLTNYMASQGIGLSPTGEIVSAAPPVTPMPAAPAVAPSSSVDFLRGMSDVSAVEGPGVAGAGLPTRSSTFASRLAAMPGKDLAKYGLSAAAPALLAPPEYEKPELDSEQYRYAYSPGPVMPPTRSGDVGEYTYFQPRFTRLAGGGPVEAMSDANAVGANTGYPMANISRGAYATPYQQPISQNVVTGSQDTRVDALTGAERFADGGDTDGYRYEYDPVRQVYKQSLPPTTSAGIKSTSSGDMRGDGGGSGMVSNTAGGFGYGMGDGGVGLIGLGQSLSGMGLNSLGNAIGNMGISQLGAAEAAAAAAGTGYGMGYSGLSDASVGLGERGAIDAANTGWGADGTDGLGGGVDAGASSGTDYGSSGFGDYAAGGITALAYGGQSHLGDYSDGGRLLRGPGDGVSDSIPATIGDKRPARLADGEFVVPARIVSELGNGSTEAGARKLYAMMNRVQAARGKTTGKGKVAKNTRAEKYLPA